MEHIDPTGLLQEALQALKDIYGASENHQPYTTAELYEIVSPILGEAYEAGIRLNGEE